MKDAKAERRKQIEAIRKKIEQANSLSQIKALILELIKLIR